MKRSKHLFVLLMTLCLFSMPSMARDNHYSGYGYNSGLSLSFGSHHKDLSIHYSGNNRGYLPYRNKHYINKRYSHKGLPTHRASASYKHKQFMKQLGSRYPHAIGHRNSHYNRYGAIHNKHYPYKRHYSKPYSNYRHHYYDAHPHGYRHQQRACHPITKVISDKYGRYHSINNTLCYDKYGRSYIIHKDRY